MFKLRKPVSSRQGPNPLQSQLLPTSLAHKYYLHIKQTLHKLNQQLQLKVLKKLSFLEQIEKVQEILKKCRQLKQNKVYIIVDILRLYREFQIKIGSDKYQIVQQLFKAIDCFISKKDNISQKNMIELMYVHRIDQILDFIWRCYRDQQQSKTIYSKISVVMERYMQLQSKLSKLMPKSQYQMLLIFNSYWISQVKKTQFQQNQQTREQRPSQVSNSSFYSKTSEPPQVYQERLKKFDETRQNEEYCQKLRFLSLNKKKRSLKKTSSFSNTSIKKVSTTWGRQQSVVFSISKQASKKSQGNVGFSKFNINNGCRKSILTFNREDLMENCSDVCASGLQTERNQYEKPFYFYTIIKGNLRLITVRRAQVVKQTGRLKIYFDGYFSYPIVFHKYPQSFIQGIQSQKLKKFLVSNVKLKQKFMWSILAPSFKIQKISEQQQADKNIISQLLDENEKYTFYGFIKKFNAFFFSRYQSDNQKIQFGTLSLFNLSFDEELEKIPISKWDKRKNIQLSDDRGSEMKDKQIEENNVNNFCRFQIGEKYITAFDINLKMKQEKLTTKLGRKTFYDKKYTKSRMKLLSNKSKCFFHTVKREQNYLVLQQSRCGSKQIFSNMINERRFRNLFLIKDQQRNRSLKQKAHEIPTQLLSMINIHDDKKQEKNSCFCNLNLRISQPRLVKICHKLNFIKRTKMGHILINIYLFQPQQTELILIQAYVQSNQKYYSFKLNSNVVDQFFSLSSFSEAENSNEFNMKQWGKVLIKMIKVKVIQVTNGQLGDFGLHIHIGEHSIQGQELIYRKCLIDKNQNPQYLDFITIASQSSTLHCHKSVLKYPTIQYLHRQILRIKKGLKVQKSQSLQIPYGEFHKSYSQYSQLKKMIKNELQKLESPQQILGNKSNSNSNSSSSSSQNSRSQKRKTKTKNEYWDNPTEQDCCYTFVNNVVRHGWSSSNVNRIIVTNQGIKIKKFERYSKVEKSGIVDTSKIGLGCLAYKMGKATIARYLKRIMKDQALYNSLFMETFSTQI